MAGILPEADDIDEDFGFAICSIILATFSHYHRGQNYYKKYFYKNIKKISGTINSAKITKQSLYKANSFACSLANRDRTSGNSIIKKMLRWSYFCNNYKDYYEYEPLDQSVAYIWGLFQMKNSVFSARFGEMKKIWGGEIVKKMHQVLVHFWGAIFALELG